MVVVKVVVIVGLLVRVVGILVIVVATVVVEVGVVELSGTYVSLINLHHIIGSCRSRGHAGRPFGVLVGLPVGLLVGLHRTSPDRRSTTCFMYDHNNTHGSGSEVRPGSPSPQHVGRCQGVHSVWRFGASMESLDDGAFSSGSDSHLRIILGGFGDPTETLDFQIPLARAIKKSGKLAAGIDYKLLAGQPLVFVDNTLDKNTARALKSYLQLCSDKHILCMNSLTKVDQAGLVDEYLLHELMQDTEEEDAEKARVRCVRCRCYFCPNNYEKECGARECDALGRCIRCGRRQPCTSMCVIYGVHKAARSRSPRRSRVRAGLGPGSGSDAPRCTRSPRS